MFMLVIFKTLERSQPGEGVERTGDGRPGGRRKHIYVNLTSHHSDSLPFKLSWDPALIASPPSLQDHIHPHTPTHTTSSASTRNASNSQGRDNRTVAALQRGWVVSPILRHNHPLLQIEMAVNLFVRETQVAS